MKQFQLIVSLLFLFSINLMAQPDNDNCDSSIDLGIAPFCDATVFYNNIGADASDIGNANSPTCFNGGTTFRDVFFSFTTAADIQNYAITVSGLGTGPNNQAVLNPQIALYRGSCQNLAELGCASATNGSNSVTLEMNLTPNRTYFLRVNDYSASAASNAGDFNLCVEELLPDVNIGESEGSTACSGTLFDSGGPDGNYSNNENFTFTICPQDFHQCIILDVENYDLEGFNIFDIFDLSDFLNFYAGENTAAPLVATVGGSSAGEPLQIQVSSPCVTIEFQSDFLLTGEGFEINWQCTPDACSNSSVDNPTLVNQLPYEGSFNTCEGGTTLVASPCSDDEFLFGPEWVFAYDSPGGVCVRVELETSLEETGVLILDGLPDDPATTCVARSTTGFIGSADLREAGRYYIFVANSSGCDDFDINITEAEICPLDPALENALCNPLNGCLREDRLPTIFYFEEGFQDLEITDANRGCWANTGVEADFLWFTIQAAADGPFGFILDSPVAPSDLDFNVWGPFNQDGVCDTPEDVIEFIRTNQPIRSSWSPTPGQTGMANTHPIFFTPVTDDFDCGSPATPNSEGDDFVRPIEASEGEVYVVLINDFDGAVESGGIAIDWSPSGEEVLEPLFPAVTLSDREICQGESVEITIDSPINTIEWLNDTETLSCSDCTNPTASPTETTTYRAAVTAPCYVDTIEVTIFVFAASAGDDREVCRGEQFQISGNENYDNATYTWTTEGTAELSCLDCPDPVVSANGAGVFNITVTLEAGDCTINDAMVLTVRPQPAPEYEVRDSVQICIGDNTDLMVDAPASNTYTWTSRPAGFNSDEPNPTVMPMVTTTYFVAVENGNCPIPSLDSVVVVVSTPPILEVSDNLTVCQGDTIQLSMAEPQEGTTYEWTGNPEIEDPTDLNTFVYPQSTGNYRLTATRGGCISEAVVRVTVTPISIEIMPADTILFCLGDTLLLETNAQPAGVDVVWMPQTDIIGEIGADLMVSPTDDVLYYASVSNENCDRIDSVFVKVDSLPVDLMIVPADTMICAGAVVELVSKTYEPSNFMDIVFNWTPSEAQQSPDSLYNLVVTPSRTLVYERVSINGGCVDTARATVNVIVPPIIMVTPEDPVLCPGESVQLEASGEDIVEYEWMPETGLSCTACPNPTASPAQTTTYTVRGKTEDGECPAEGMVTVQVLPPPVLGFPNGRVICLGDAITLNTNPIAAQTYTWTSTDPAFGTVTDPAPTVSPLQTSTYSVTVSNGENCAPFEDQLTIVVVEEATLELSDDIDVCEDSPSVTLEAGGNYEGRFQWSIGGNIIQTDISVSNSVLMVDDRPGTTTYVLEYIAGPNCQVIIDSVQVTRNPYFPIDDVTFNLSDDVRVCEGESTTLEASAEQSGRFQWSIAGTVIQTDNNTSNSTITVNNPGSTNYIVQYFDGLNCEISMDSVRVTNVPNFSIDSIGCTPFQESYFEGTEFTAEVFTSIPAGTNVTYTWTDQQGNTIGTDKSVIITAAAEFPGPDVESVTVTYNVTILTEDGCEQTTSKQITVRRADYGIPNAFAPNGDVDMNKTFNVMRGSDNIELLELKVYNRWGRLVYNNETPNTGWNGQYNGRDAPSDVYVYYAVIRKADGESVVEQGEVTLLR